MKYNVLIYGDPRLREKAKPITTITKSIKHLAEDMLETMHAANGIGLAATQIGEPWRICVIDLPASKKNQNKDAQKSPGIEFPLIMLNPVIIETSDGEISSEGCLSFFGLTLQIKRSSTVVATYLTLHNKSICIRASGLLARAIQHEIDHLDGILFIDRLSLFKKARAIARFRRIKSRIM